MPNKSEIEGALDRMAETWPLPPEAIVEISRVRLIDGNPVWDAIPPEEFYLPARDILKEQDNGS